MTGDSAHEQKTDRFNLRALYETSRLLDESQDVELVLNNLLLSSMSKLLVTRGIALLPEGDEEGLRVTASKGISGLEVGTQLYCGDIPESLLQGDEIHETLRQHKIELVIPVTYGSQKIGLFGLGAPANGGSFSKGHLEFIEALANMTAMDVHNTFMVRELEQTNRVLDGKIQQMNTLFELSQEFNSTINRPQLVKLLSFALMGQMLIKTHVFLLRRGGDDGGAPVFRAVSQKGIVDLETKNVQSTFLQDLRDVVHCSSNGALPEEVAWINASNIELLIPLQHKGETCAVLGLGPKMTGQPYREDEIEFLFALGNLAFVSIENTYLVEEQIEKERLEEEMRLARGIQEGLLPQEKPEVHGLQIASIALPSRHVGGDYYDLLLRDNRLLFAIADVTGKGVPASLLMANIQACFHTMAPMQLELEEAVSHMNRVICKNTGSDKFITAFIGVYHTDSREVHYVNAGHDPPRLLRSDGSLELLEDGGLLLGVIEGMPYLRGTLTMDVGDVLVLYTDGVTEAMGGASGDEEYGEERLEKVLRAHRDRSADEILQHIRQDIIEHTGSATDLSDDLTSIVLKVV